jgi:hypothetical protein
MEQYRRASFVTFALALLLAYTPFALGGDADTMRDQYFAMKRAFMKHPDKVSLKSDVYNGQLALYNCVGAEMYHYDTLGTSVLANLAHDVVFLRETVKSAGYDDSIWRPILIDFEDRALRMLISGRYPADHWKPYESLRDTAGERLASALNTRGGKRINAYYMGECGAGEIEIRARVEPAGASVSIIPLWNWYLCQELGKNPDDRRACTGWSTFTNRTKLYLAGDYRYNARWPTGTKTSDSLRIRDSLDPYSNEIVFTESGVYFR